MTKKDFTDEVAKRCMITPYVVEEIFNVSLGIIVEELLKGKIVEIPKLGKFDVKCRNTTTYKNMFGKEDRVIEGFSYPVFQISSGLKTRVKNGSKYQKAL